MEQFGLALILFAAFWVGCAAGFIAMRLRVQLAYEKGRIDSATEIASLQERLNNREQLLNELKQRAETAPEPAPQSEAAPSQTLIGDFVEPIRSSLERVDTRIGELERDRTAALTGLQKQLESMLSALRTPAAGGAWGEVQLRRVVELAGMVAHCDFVEPTAAGADARPDLIVQLPNRRQIVIDSKAPLSAWNEGADNRKLLADNIRAHVTNLSGAEYWRQFQQKPEFVVAFLPGEGIFCAVLEADPELLEYGVERNVILATPTTLIALLRAVAWGWKQELASADAQEIRDLGKGLYDRLRGLAEHFNEVQRSLTGTNLAFNRAVGSFQTDVVPSARRLRELGAAGTGEITSPESLQQLAGATETTEPVVV